MSPKILVIDDHKETLDLISLVLQKQGYRVKIAHSGQDGLDLAADYLPDLILLDVMMPDMDGFTVCKKVRATKKIESTPIILLTAKSQPDEKWEGFEAGATDYLIKPTNAEELHRRVKTILDNHKKKSAPKLKAGSATVMTMSPFTRSKMTVFVGARGGCGTTTAAINTAYAHAITEYTLLVDLDMTQGHIAHYLNQKVTQGLNELTAGIPMNVAGQLRNNFVKVSPNLTMLPAKPNIDAELPIMGEKHLPHLVEAMHNTGKSIIVDGGRGIHEGNRSVLERADQIVVCARPDRISMANARQLIKSLNDLILPTCLVHTLLIGFGPSPKLPEEKVKSYLNTSLAGNIQIPVAELAKSVNEGKPIVINSPDSELTKQFRTLAEKVAKL